VSSRHFEAIGAKTCQILLEGAYNGLLEPDVHYISVQKDMSDLDAALERFADPGERRRVADEAYEHVLARHTYAHRVAQLLDAVE
jgi:spore maturation protein CgeB